MRIEHWRYTLPLRLRSIFRRNRVEREAAEELQFHLERMIEEGIGLGLTADEARRRALRALGGLDQRREQMRDARRVSWLTDFVDDVGFACRALRRTPGLAALVILTLALGIGMTATPFSMLDALVLRPYPVPDPEAVLTVVGTTRDAAYEPFSRLEYLDLRDRATGFDGVVASGPVVAAGFAAAPRETPRVTAAMLVSGNFFRVLGVEPQLGRGFRDDEDDVPGRDAVAVVSHEFWQRDLAADPAVVGRAVRLNGAEFTIVGVAPQAFPGLQIFLNADVYVPLAMAARFSAEPHASFFDDRAARGLTVRGRLRHDVSLAEARAEVAAIARDFERTFPETNRHRGAAVHTRREMRTRKDDVNWKFGVIFTVLAVSVLLVACTNVASLLLGRARGRSREIAVRLALGAGRSRLVRLLLAESLVLALLGGLLGIALGYLGIELLQRFTIPADLPTKVPFRMDERVLLACLAMSLLSAFACGLAPAFTSTRRDLVSGLKAADADPPGRRRLWGRSALVVAQVAVSLMLLSAALLMARSFRQSVDGGVGFAIDHLLLARFDPRLAQYDAARTASFYDELVRRARQMPGVRSAGLTQSPPFGLDGFATLDFVPEGIDLPEGRESYSTQMDVVDDGFFTTTGIPVVRGRDFLPSDDADAPRVAIVNEQFAGRWFPGADPVGRRIRLGDAGGAPVEIVGVARKIKHAGSTDDWSELVYLPLAQNPRARLVLLLRTEQDPLAAFDPLRELVRAVASDLPISELRTYDDLYDYHVVEGPGVAIKLVGSLGGVGVALAIAGLYGLVAFDVARRTREIGIRMAIGAAPGNVLRQMMGRGLALVAIGTAIGLALGFGVERLMKAMIFHAAGVDVVAYLLVVPAMLVATLLAAYVPARRAARISPTRALRCE
jgi:predicted permease